MPFKGSGQTWDIFQQHIDGFTVMPYRKIIVGVDHSSASAVVLQRAIQLARAFSARLIVVHVVATIHPLEKKQGPIADATYLEFIRAAGEDVVRSAKKKLEASGVDGEVIEAEGIPSKEILAVVKEKGADLLIVGSKEKVGSLAHLGSVSKALSEKAKCSLLIERACEKC
jgi:nucleotide-binding universal stress UspA family protein